MRLGIFGGTFDPIHYGHLLLAQCCLEQCPLDEVAFLPAAVPPHKQRQELAPAEARIEMIELAIAGNEFMSVCRYETQRGGVNYTVETLTHLHEEDPRRELFFLLGADMFRDLPRWREAQRVCQLAWPVVVGRAGEPPVDFDVLRDIASPEWIDQVRRHQVRMPEIGLSGTDLRRRVREGEGIRYRTPRAVGKYIQTHGLYRV